ncbi:MAG: adenylosuccinate lyase [Chloroflexota bacterium]|jgi:adenylosuccinate lyase|nr:adenylosuccinate lyase [Chloroflexota bacterium]
MPLPTRYSAEVPELEEIWSPTGYFQAQAGIWLAECEALAEIEGHPSPAELAQIRQALTLDADDLVQLNRAEGHETNRLIRLVQSRLPVELGNLIHRGNTSSDVLDTSLAMQIIRSLEVLAADFEALARVLAALALQHAETLQVGRTHGQHGIPQTFGRQVLGWYAEVGRGIERIARARQVIAVGKLSGEVGTSVFISPILEERALARLGLTPDPAPTQIISRDRHAEVVALMAVNASSLCRIATNISLLAITDVGEVREPFDAAAQQGSSAMPHKRNTELTERIRGLSRRVWSAAQEELGSAVLWLERDISHSSTERFTFPDTFGCLSYAARLTTRVVEGLIVNTDQMRANTERTFGGIYAARLLNALLDRGQLSRTEAYELVKGLAQHAMDAGVPLAELAASEPQLAVSFNKEDLQELFSPEFYLRNIRVAYERAGLGAHPAGNGAATPPDGAKVRQ